MSKKRKKQPMCKKCGSVEMPKYRRVCDACESSNASATRDYYRNLVIEGKCPKCKKATDRPRGWCTDCLAWSSENAAAIKAECLEAYGGKCACCGEHRISFLTIDHIKGGGNKNRQGGELPGTGAGASMYGWLKKKCWPQEFQCLCWNCNFCKHARGVCCHKNKGNHDAI